MDCYQIASIVLQSFTLVVLIIYTFFTCKMAKVSEENISLTKELQAKESFPIIALTMGVSPECPYGRIETLFRLHNTTRYNAMVWVTVDARVKGVPYDWSRVGGKKYSGSEPWPAPAFAMIQGHFDFARMLPEGMIATPPSHPIPPPPKETLIINLKYKWSDKEGARIEEGMEQQWYYDFASGQWVFDI